MSEQINEQEKQLTETPENQIAENTIPEIEKTPDNRGKMKSLLVKKKFIIIAAAAAIVIAIALIILIPSKFERVENECLQISGSLSRGDNYFELDTYPDEYKRMDDSTVALLLPDKQNRVLEAIRYANTELGFNGSVYSQMLETTALMGRLSEENSKYKVTWTYHPDDGLEVIYEKKH